MNCIFCKIINNEISSKTIYEDDIVKVFLDINPDSNGHTLIIPKKHIVDMTDMDDETMIHIFNIAKKLRKELEDKLHIDGLTLMQNNGYGQEVKHFHLHLKPLYREKQEKKEVDEIYSILKATE